MAQQETPTAADSNTQQRQPVQVDYSQAVTDYVNFCRVNWTPEEVMVDFGLKTTTGGGDGEPVDASSRVIMNFYTAKRLLGALHYAIQHYEHTFGPLEIDAAKRAKELSGNQDA